MKNLVGCALLPHPPVMVPEVGRQQLEKIKETVAAVKHTAQMLSKNNPSTVVIISPHGTVFRDAVAIVQQERLSGNLASFGVPEVALDFAIDSVLTSQILAAARQVGVSVLELMPENVQKYQLTLKLDHGAFVPLYYLQQAGFTGQIVHISVGMLTYEEMYTLGKAVQKTIDTADKSVAVIASGDLAHRLLPSAPAGYSPKAKELDKQIVMGLRTADVKALLAIEPELIAAGGECGLRPIFFLMGVMAGLGLELDTLSYEGPFGVGYAVALYKQPVSAAKKEGSIQVMLAQKSMEYYLATGKVMAQPAVLPPGLQAAAGVFVSLKKRGQLRGCIGTFGPTRENIAVEIIYNAISAATRDPRFSPVQAEELRELTVSVDVLNPPEQVHNIADLDPKIYGVIVRSGERSGLLLPDLAGVETAEEQINIAAQKGGIQPGSAIDLFRFTVTRYY